MKTAKVNKPDLSKFTMERYESIVKYKTSFYSFVMPVELAMKMASITDPELYRQANSILLEIGLFFQIQDDYLDCYGDPKITGKHCTDIQSGKCSWLSVVALQRSSPKQRQIMEECYGSEDPQHVAAVRALYEELGLRSTYNIYEEASHSRIRTHIQQISGGLPHALFLNILNKLYRRKR